MEGDHHNPLLHFLSPLCLTFLLESMNRVLYGVFYKSNAQKVYIYLFACTILIGQTSFHIHIFSDCSHGEYEYTHLSSKFSSFLFLILFMSFFLGVPSKKPYSISFFIIWRLFLPFSFFLFSSSGSMMTTTSAYKNAPCFLFLSQDEFFI